MRSFDRLILPREIEKIGPYLRDGKGSEEGRDSGGEGEILEIVDESLSWDGDLEQLHLRGSRKWSGRDMGQLEKRVGGRGGVLPHQFIDEFAREVH